MNKFAVKDSEKMFASLTKELADFFSKSEETIMTSSCPPKKTLITGCGSAGCQTDFERLG